MRGNTREDGAQELRPAPYRRGQPPRVHLLRALVKRLVLGTLKARRRVGFSIGFSAEALHVLRVPGGRGAAARRARHRAPGGGGRRGDGGPLCPRWRGPRGLPIFAAGRSGSCLVSSATPSWPSAGASAPVRNHSEPGVISSSVVRPLRASVPSGRYAPGRRSPSWVPDGKDLGAARRAPVYPVREAPHLRMTALAGVRTDRLGQSGYLA